MTEPTELAVTEIAADPRAGYIEGLRILAGVLADNPRFPLPFRGQNDTLSLGISASAAGPERATEIVRMLGTPVSQRIRTSEHGGKTYTWLDLAFRIAGLYVTVTLQADQVCQRVVTGTTEVVEWRFGSIVGCTGESASDGSA